MLDSILDAARLNPLSPPQLEELVAEAKRLGKVQQVVNTLVLAGPVGAANLRACTGLLVAHAHERASAPRRKSSNYMAVAPVEQYYHLTDMTVTSHAVERYIQHHGAGRSKDDILLELTTESANASPVRERSVNGDEVRISPNGTRFIVRRDHDQHRPVCVTILPTDDNMRRRPSRRSRRS